SIRGSQIAHVSSVKVPVLSPSSIPTIWEEIQDLTGPSASCQVGDDRIQPDYIDIAISSIVEGGYADAFRIFGFFN
ncbi:hypothetical protein, partial [Acetobacter sp. AAB5]|uniref:hypothetical protein n=1 Tax=Acetobacter sp. AAB5 TaxID=3418370 RepID=UPI003CF82B13